MEKTIVGVHFKNSWNDDFGGKAYELQVLKNHLSKAKCNDFIYKNIGPQGRYVYLHCHIDHESGEEDNQCAAD